MVPSGSPEEWVPAPDVWTPQNPMPLEHWKISQGRVEHIPYNARACNWQRSEVDQLPRLVFSNFITVNSDVPGNSSVMAAIDQQNADESLSSSEEEGEIVSTAPPPDPCWRSHMDSLSAPVLGSLRRGAIIMHDKYSSSPLVAPSESTVDHSAYDHIWNVGDSAATTE
jgi:hypothetical protein